MISQQNPDIASNSHDFVIVKTHAPGICLLPVSGGLQGVMTCKLCKSQFGAQNRKSHKFPACYKITGRQNFLLLFLICWCSLYNIFENITSKGSENLEKSGRLSEITVHPQTQVIALSCKEAICPKTRKGTVLFILIVNTQFKRLHIS